MLTAYSSEKAWKKLGKSIIQQLFPAVSLVANKSKIPMITKSGHNSFLDVGKCCNKGHRATTKNTFDSLADAAWCSDVVDNPLETHLNDFYLFSYYFPFMLDFLIPCAKKSKYRKNIKWRRENCQAKANPKLFSSLSGEGWFGVVGG